LECLTALLRTLKEVPTLTTLASRPLRLDACPVCGTEAEEAERTGFAGCPICYAVFDLKPCHNQKRESVPF
jgi:protein-arginine kinase activator protein McsA